MYLRYVHSVVNECSIETTVVNNVIVVNLP